MNFYKNILFYILFLCLLSYSLAAQVAGDGQLTFHIEGLKATRTNLNYYYGEQAFRADSAIVDTATGTVRFSSKNRHAGMYFLSIKGGRLFDFILDKSNVSFTVKTSMARLDSLQAEGSPENTAFFQYNLLDAALLAKIEQMQANLKLIAQATRNDSLAMAGINAQVLDYQVERIVLYDRFIQAHPDFLYAKLLRTIRRPFPGNLAERVKSGAPNPEYYAWLSQYHWKGSDFTDERLV